MPVFTIIAHLYTLPGKEAEAKAKLAEASRTYLKDNGTLAWTPMQDAKDPTAWAIVERYEQQSDVKTHQANPFFKAFPKVMGPLLDPKRPMKLAYYHEVETGSRAKL
ncbi:DNA repair protein [Favolaschia claudopus]|uniref:DNA repair protein n=1 Tax=Favolaschia claudopus TaxID=2862362 RepID=A0AAW0BJP6_9AGAR